MIVFLHGFESGPGGTKARWLKERYGAVTPTLDTTSLAAAVEGARAAIEAHRPALVVGSSFGGAVAIELLARGLWSGPAVLIAPAHTHFGGATTLPAGARVVVLHGTDDDVVPVEDSRALAGADLWEIPGGDHRLNRILEDGTLARAIAALTTLGAPAA